MVRKLFPALLLGMKENIYSYKRVVSDPVLSCYVLPQKTTVRYAAKQQEFGMFPLKNLVILNAHIWPSFIKRVAMETEWLVCVAGVRNGRGSEFARARGRREEVPLPRPSATFALFARPKSPFSCL